MKWKMLGFWFYRIILVASQNIFGWVGFCCISTVLVTALQTASGLCGYLWVWSPSVLFLLSLLPLCYNWSIIHWSLSLGACVRIEWFVVTAWVGQLELNAWKNLWVHREEILLLNAFYEYSTSWWSTSHSVRTVQYHAVCLREAPLNQCCFSWLSISQDTAAFSTQPPAARSIIQKGNRCSWHRHTHINPA